MSTTQSDVAIDPVDTPDGDVPLSLGEYREIHEEIEHQPRVAPQADKEMDYAEGNQLKTELLQARRRSASRRAWRTSSARAGRYPRLRGGDPHGLARDAQRPAGGQDVADALNFKLNEAERGSRADDACSRAFYPQIGVGLGWVEVSRSDDPFAYPTSAKPSTGTRSTGT